MKVVLTPSAQRDLEIIGNYIARDNAPRAASFVDELLARCDDLATFPERFPLVERYRDAGVRSRVHGRYLILYRIDDGVVRVLHIVQGATDYSTLLDE